MFKKISFPSAQTILFIIAGLVALLTWFVPAGQFNKLSYNKEAKAFDIKSPKSSIQLPATQRILDSLNILVSVEKFTSGDIYKPISIPNTYQEVDPNQQGFLEFVKSPIKGIIAAADIIFLVLIIGGMIGIMNATGAFNAGISWLAKKLEGREYLLIIFVSILIALGGTTFGLSEETIAFIPILIPVFIKARYDALVGLSSIFLGSCIGTMCSTVNPFATIIASDAAGIAWTTGLYGRLFMLILCLMIGIAYMIRYAERVKEDPTKSLIHNQKEEIEALFHMDDSKEIKLTWRLRLILFVFMASFIIMIIGVSKLHWWFVEMTATFLVGGILIGIIARMKESAFISEFNKGAGELLGVAFIIGIARGVSVLMDDGNISDTMLYFASNLTEGMNKGVFINVMLAIFSGLSFFIPSSSGMAVLTMPIISPLADTVGIGRQFIVNAYQYGSGIFSFINPTGIILASLAIVKIGFNKWLKFVMPLFIALIITTIVVLTASLYIF